MPTISIGESSRATRGFTSEVAPIARYGRRLPWTPASHSAMSKGREPRRPRTTMRYDCARVSLDRHATYIVPTLIAGASR